MKNSIRRVTITDIAGVAGVSKSTVSLVLQGSTLIRPETATRVRDAAAALGYVYNRGAAALRRNSSNVVGVVINDLLNPFFAELLVGMERTLATAGYVSLMAHTGERLDVQDKVLASLREQRAAGLILCPAFHTPLLLRQTLQSWGIPLLIVIRPLGEGGYDFVGSDNETGAYLATEHLIKQGHRRIAFLGRSAGGPVYDRRRAGYERALAAFDLTGAPDCIIDVPPTRAGGFEGTVRALALADRPTAAVCYNDVEAFGALGALGEKGLAAGRDFGIVGFDGVAATEHFNPPLSTMNVSPARLGEIAAETLLLRLADPKAPPQTHITVPRLVVRQSSARPPDSTCAAR